MSKSRLLGSISIACLTLSFMSSVVCWSAESVRLPELCDISQTYTVDNPLSIILAIIGIAVLSVLNFGNMQNHSDNFAAQSPPGDNVDIAAELKRARQEIGDLRDELEEKKETLATYAEQITFAMRRFQELFDNLPTACYCYDEDGIIREWNNACNDLFGLTATEVFERAVWDVVGCEDTRELTQDMVSRVCQGEKIENLELRYTVPSGSKREILCSSFSIRGADGTIVGGISANTDITTLKEQERQIAKVSKELESKNKTLSKMAITDGLTGLNNHRAFQDKLESEFLKGSRNLTPLSVVLMDVDKFKTFNDEFGHPAGDSVLKQVAECLKQSVRGIDFVARYGGEEFVLILPNTNTDSAALIAERCRVTIQDATWPFRPVTASFGVSSSYDFSGTKQDLVDQADRALYLSKEHGRNRITRADAASPESLDKEAA